PAGTVTVWYIEPSPFGSVPVRVPKKADCVPLCAAALDTTGAGLVPKTTHGGKLPVSKPPLVTCSQPGVGVTVGVGVGVRVGVGVGVGTPGVGVTVGTGVPAATLSK